MFTGNLVQPTMTISGLPEARKIFRALQDVLRTLSESGRSIDVAPMIPELSGKKPSGASAEGHDRRLTADDLLDSDDE